MAENVKIIATLEVPEYLREAVTGHEDYFREALQDIIEDSRSRGVFSQAVVTSFKVLGPGQGYRYCPSTEEIVPAAAGAGEAKTLEEVLEAERFFYLRREQRDRVAMLLNNFMAPEPVEVLGARFSQTTNTLITFIRFRSGFEQWYAQTLLPETITFILGEDEDWDPTKM